MTHNQPPQKVLPDKQAQQQRLGEIGRRVLHTLGQPGDLQKVQVCHLWGECYRVNILVGVNFASARVVHSYFVIANESGTILNSTPPVTRAYEPPPPRSGFPETISGLNPNKT